MWCIQKTDESAVDWAHKTKDWILQQMNVDKQLLGKVKLLKLGYLLQTYDKKMELSEKGYITRLYTGK